MRDIAQRMADEFNPQGYQINTAQMSYALAWVISIFVKEMNNAVQGWGKDTNFDHSQAEKVLGIKF